MAWKLKRTGHVTGCQGARTLHVGYLQVAGSDEAARSVLMEVWR